MPLALRAYRADVPDVRALVSLVAGVSDATGCALQLLRADRLYGREHVERAVRLAEKAFRDGRNTSQGLGLEIALYASGERQLGKALKRVGLAEGAGREVVAVAIGDDPDAALDALAANAGFERDDALLRPRIEALDSLGVTKAERAMLPEKRWVELALERVALTDLLKTQ